jgi:predicted transcriptional regulator
MTPPGLRWLRGRTRDELDGWFGKLERRVLDLQNAFPETAYTTLMTTLDRLHRKGVLDRAKDGRAFVYTPRFTRDDLRAGLAERALHTLLGDDAARVRPLLSFLVDAVTRGDREALDELEQLVRQKRNHRERQK